MTAEDISFIRESYATAKNKRNQIRILAQLYEADPSDIANLLGVDGIPAKIHPSKGKHYPVEFRKKVAKEMMNGLSHRAASEKYGVSAQTVWMWKKKYGSEN